MKTQCLEKCKGVLLNLQLAHLRIESNQADTHREIEDRRNIPTPIVQERLKWDDERPYESDHSDPTVSSLEETGSSSSSSSTTLGLNTNNQDSDNDKQKPNTNVTTVKKDLPKGSLKTKFYGVKKPSGDTTLKRKRNYKCPECTQSYHNQSQLNNHYKAEHPLVTCPKCDLSFNTLSTLAKTQVCSWRAEVQVC